MQNKYDLIIVKQRVSPKKIKYEANTKLKT